MQRQQQQRQGVPVMGQHVDVNALYPATPILSRVSGSESYAMLLLFLATTTSIRRICCGTCVTMTLHWCRRRFHNALSVAHLNSCNNHRCVHYSVSQKNPPEVFWYFPQTVGNFRPNFASLLIRLLYVPTYARLQIVIQLRQTVMKLCHIKCDQPTCVSVNGGHFGHMMWTRWSRLIWHNLVKVAGKRIKICTLA